MRGKAAPTEVPRPLHRLTGLRDDPTLSWLSPTGARNLAFSGWLWWAGYVFTLALPGVIAPALLLGPLFGNYFVFATLFAGVLLFSTARRLIVRLQNGKMQEMVAATVEANIHKADDWNALEQEPDGAAISLVGWARGRISMPTTVGGQPAIGIALACVQSYRGVLESVHDFDLVDEHGRSVAISVAGGRALGEPNARVFSDDEGRMLVASLDLPPGVMPTGDALVLRDGDPLMIVGFKDTVVDPAQPGMRQPPVRVTIRSSRTRPLLIYSLAAERRPTAPERRNEGPG